MIDAEMDGPSLSAMIELGDDLVVEGRHQSPSVRNDLEGELAVVADELHRLDLEPLEEAIERRALAGMIRRVAYRLTRDDDSGLPQARSTIHACLARLAPLQQASPCRRPGPLAAPGEQWLLAPPWWGDQERTAAVTTWCTIDRPPGLVLLIPTFDDLIPTVDQVAAGRYPLASDSSVRLLPAAAVCALELPVTLLSSGDPVLAVRTAVAQAGS